MLSICPVPAKPLPGRKDKCCPFRAMHRAGAVPSAGLASVQVLGQNPGLHELPTLSGGEKREQTVPLDLPP